MTTIVRYALGIAAIVVSPLYALWALGGYLADKRGQRLYCSKVKEWRERQ